MLHSTHWDIVKIVLELLNYSIVLVSVLADEHMRNPKYFNSHDSDGIV